MQFIKNMVEKNGKKKTWWLLGLLFVGIMLLVVSTLFANRQGGGNNDNWQVSPIDFDAQDNYGNYQLSIINYQLTESLSQYLTRQLEEILSLVAGAGNVRVMLTMGSGASVFAQNTQTSHSATTEDDGEGGTRAIDTETSQITYVMVRQSDGSERPLRLQDVRPQTLGVVIVAQGAADVAVRDALIRGAAAALSIGTHQVQVLQMSQ